MGRLWCRLVICGRLPIGQGHCNSQRRRDYQSRAGYHPAPHAAAGMTLVELIVAFTILLILTSMAVPVARTNVRRIKERRLREALHEIHTAIDKYKDMADAGKLGVQKLDTYGYPETLEALVEGVKGSGQAA